MVLRVIPARQLSRSHVSQAARLGAGGGAHSELWQTFSAGGQEMVDGIRFPSSVFETSEVITGRPSAEETPM